MKNKELNLKKKIIDKIKATPDQAIFFFDESRFGTHSKLGHGWFEKGKRTQVNIKLGFQNFYLYSAVNPKTGEDFTLIAPKVNTEYMNVFLDQIAAFVKNAPISIVMDCAGWHRSRGLKIPHNISIIFLPPYSPELNTVERLWGYIKQHTIKNKIYGSLELLELAIVDFFKTINHTTISSLCRIDYM
jgi:transposase